MRSTTKPRAFSDTRPRFLDLAFFTLVVITSFVAYGLPLMVFPTAPSNPWPYAYNVIQQQIIEKGKMLVETPQFGGWQRSDHTWFLLHHVSYVNLKLLSGLPFETLERSLSFVLSIAFFFGFYVFAKKALGDTVGFIGAIFMLLVPRTHNYLVTVNGEFIGWLILLPALGLFFEFSKNRNLKFLILSSLLAAFLPLSNLMVFLEYLVVVGAFLISDLVARRNLKRFLKLAFFIVLPVLFISLPVLYASGDIHAGASSTIGSLYSNKSPTEAEYERIYYNQYADYWKTYQNKLPVLTELTYIVSDYVFWFGTGFIFVFYVPLAVVGAYYSLKNHKQPRLLFPLTWIIIQIALDSAILSSIFGPTVNAGGIRLLLYFGWPLSLLSGLGLYFLIKHISRIEHVLSSVGFQTLKTILHNWRLLILAIFVGSFIFTGIWAAKRSAGFANTYTMLYSKEYTDAFVWLRENTPRDAIIVANDWTSGEIFLATQRLALIEGGKGSATYITYEEIVTKLQDARTVFRSENLTEIIMILNKYEAEWILIWNKPLAYKFNISPLEQLNLSKFETSDRFVKVFEEEGSYAPCVLMDAYGSQYTSTAVIYHLNQSSTTLYSQVVGQDANNQTSSDTPELAWIARFTYSFLFALFLPGYAWTLFFFNERMHTLERILLSLSFSFAFTAITYFWLNLVGLDVSLNSTVIVVAFLTIIPLTLSVAKYHLRSHNAWRKDSTRFMNWLSSAKFDHETENQSSAKASGSVEVREKDSSKDTAGRKSRTSLRMS